MALAQQRILILSSNTGGGHGSAAQALEESFMRLGPVGRVGVNIATVLEDANAMSRKMADFYNYLLRHHQQAMQYYFSAIEKLKPYQSHFLFQMGSKYGVQLIEKLAPTTLVSVHPMTQHFFAYLLKKLGLSHKIPLVTVVTDPYDGFWQGWACEDVDRYFVASDAAKDQLVAFGMLPEKITVTGMPVHARFQPSATVADKRAIRQELGIDPDKFTVLVNAGWVGGGNVPALYETLMQCNLPNTQFIFLTGKNPELYRQAEQLAQQSTVPVSIVGFTDDMLRYMQAADVMFSKLGGLTTFEAMACQLPILGDCLTPPMPQEAATARLISQHGAGALITEPQQVLAELDKLMNQPNTYTRMQTAATQLGHPGAVDVITREILALSAN